jgi:spore germination protein YaaH
MKRHDVVIAVAAGLALVAMPSLLHAPTFMPQREPFVTAAWLPTWDPRATASLPSAVSSGVTEIGPTWATVDRHGQLVMQPPSARAQLQLAGEGVRTIPIIQNYDHGWQGDRMAALLSDPTTATAQRRALVDAARAGDWDGIDIDYENLPPSAGPSLLAFLTALRDDLHADGRVLTIAVPARAGDDDPGTLAYGYQALGAVADELQIMAYDHSWGGSAAGPIAPPGWVRAVVSYAVARVPRERLMLGLATYGYDWVGTTGAELGAADALALAVRQHATPVWDAEGGGTTFDYTLHGQRHTVWFQDARAVALDARIAYAAGLRGVALWKLGGEDPATWTALRDAVGVTR